MKKNYGSAILVNKGFSDNLGDQAINNVAKNTLKEYGFSDVYSHDYTSLDRGVKKINTSEINKSKLKGLIKYILPLKIIWLIKNYSRLANALNNNSEYVFIGGGQLILSNTYFPIAAYLWTYLANKYNKEVVFLSVGVGSKYKILDKYLLGKALNKASSISVRDERSRITLKNIFNVDSTLTGDIVFCEESKGTSGVEKENDVLLGIPGLYVYNEYNSKLRQVEYFEFWTDFLENHDISFNLITLFYTTTEDYFESLAFQSYVAERYDVILPILSCSTLAELELSMKKYHRVVSGRMHGLILGLNNDCSIISFPISNKLKSFQQSIDKYTSFYAYKQYVSLKTTDFLNRSCK